MKISLNYYLVNIGAFFCTMPFVAPIPIVPDVLYLNIMNILSDVISRNTFASYFGKFFYNSINVLLSNLDQFTKNER